jgi:hypothetical protein
LTSCGIASSVVISPYITVDIVDIVDNAAVALLRIRAERQDLQGVGYDLVYKPRKRRELY